MLTNKITHVIGVDEAGRGPIAGPVTVGMVAVPIEIFLAYGLGGKWFAPHIDRLTKSQKGLVGSGIRGLMKSVNSERLGGAPSGRVARATNSSRRAQSTTNYKDQNTLQEIDSLLLQLRNSARDSKKLSEKKREQVHATITQLKKICEPALFHYATSSTGPAIIDENGIRSALDQAVARGLSKFSCDPMRVLIVCDGSLWAHQKYVHQHTIIKGDDRVPLISAASIVAKVTRDTHMLRIDQDFPEYSFGQNKGYGTRGHYDAIRSHGLINKVHRKSWIKD